MGYKFLTVDVFTDQIFGGNPLAVFPQADGLGDGQMKKVAKELNLSEVVFIFPPTTPEATHRLRIFTPDMELPFAGHPTIGTAYVLAATGAIPLGEPATQVMFEEGVGLVPVTIRVRNQQPTFTQLAAAQMPERGPTPPPLTEIAGLLSLDENDLVGGEMSPQAWSAGVPFLFVSVRDREALSRARVRLDMWERILKDFWSPHVYVFTHDTEGAAMRARMFAPAMGIPEDPATGAAATALAGYLAQSQGDVTGMVGWVIEQGVEMGRRSLLDVEADLVNGTITAVRVGGASVLVSAGVMEIPDV